MKILYCSNTGHTARYAELLAHKTGLAALPASRVAEVAKGEEIVYLGWVFADVIQGYKKTCEGRSVACVAAVGMNPGSAENAEKLVAANGISVPFFYLPGGVDYAKLKGVKRMMLRMVGKQLAKEGKPENQALISVSQNGGDFVSEANLVPLLEFLAQRLQPAMRQGL